MLKNTEFKVAPSLSDLPCSEKYITDIYLGLMRIPEEEKNPKIVQLKIEQYLKKWIEEDLGVEKILKSRFNEFDVNRMTFVLLHIIVRNDLISDKTKIPEVYKKIKGCFLTCALSLNKEMKSFLESSVDAETVKKISNLKNWLASVSQKFKLFSEMDKDESNLILGLVDYFNRNIIGQRRIPEFQYDYSFRMEKEKKLDVTAKLEFSLIPFPALLNPLLEKNAAEIDLEIRSWKTFLKQFASDEKMLCINGRFYMTYHILSELMIFKKDYLKAIQYLEKICDDVLKTQSDYLKEVEIRNIVRSKKNLKDFNKLNKNNFIILLIISLVGKSRLAQAIYIQGVLENKPETIELGVKKYQEIIDFSKSRLEDGSLIEFNRSLERFEKDTSLYEIRVGEYLYNLYLQLLNDSIFLLSYEIFEADKRYLKKFVNNENIVKILHETLQEIYKLDKLYLSIELLDQDNYPNYKNKIGNIFDNLVNYRLIEFVKGDFNTGGLIFKDGKNLYYLIIILFFMLRKTFSGKSNFLKNEIVELLVKSVNLLLTYDNMAEYPLIMLIDLFDPIYYKNEDYFLQFSLLFNEIIKKENLPSNIPFLNLEEKIPTDILVELTEECEKMNEIRIQVVSMNSNIKFKNLDGSLSFLENISLKVSEEIDFFKKKSFSCQNLFNLIFYEKTQITILILKIISYQEKQKKFLFAEDHANLIDLWKLGAALVFELNKKVDEFLRFINLNQELDKFLDKKIEALNWIDNVLKLSMILSGCMVINFENFIGLREKNHAAPENYKYSPDYFLRLPELKDDKPSAEPLMPLENSFENEVEKKSHHKVKPVKKNKHRKIKKIPNKMQGKSKVAKNQEKEIAINKLEGEYKKTTLAEEDLIDIELTIKYPENIKNHLENLLGLFLGRHKIPLLVKGGLIRDLLWDTRSDGDCDIVLLLKVAIGLKDSLIDFLKINFKAEKNEKYDSLFMYSIEGISYDVAILDGAQEFNSPDFLINSFFADISGKVYARFDFFSNPELAKKHILSRTLIVPPVNIINWLKKDDFLIFFRGFRFIAQKNCEFGCAETKAVQKIIQGGMFDEMKARKKALSELKKVNINEQKNLLSAFFKFDFLSILFKPYFFESNFNNFVLKMGYSELLGLLGKKIDFHDIYQLYFLGCRLIDEDGCYRLIIANAELLMRSPENLIFLLNCVLKYQFLFCISQVRKIVESKLHTEKWLDDNWLGISKALGQLIFRNNAESACIYLQQWGLLSLLFPVANMLITLNPNARDYVFRVLRKAESIEPCRRNIYHIYNYFISLEMINTKSNNISSEIKTLRKGCYASMFNKLNPQRILSNLEKLKQNLLIY